MNSKVSAFPYQLPISSHSNVYKKQGRGRPNRAVAGLASLLTLLSLAAGSGWLLHNSILIAASLGMMVVTITLALRWRYRPPENHLAVIHRLDRFYGFLNPDEWTVLIPHIFSVQQEVNLGKRTAVVSLKDVYTKDRIPVDIDLKIFFSVDLRQTAPASLMQALSLPGEGWEGMVRTNATDVSRNVVVIAFNFEDLNSPRGRQLLKKTISSYVSERVRNMGIQVNPQFGVSIQNLQPEEDYRKAMQARTAARQVGWATVEQFTPIAQALYPLGFQPEDVMRLMAASTLAGGGQLPSYMFAEGEILRGNPWERGFSGAPVIRR